MNQQNTLMTGVLVAGLAVAFGAFGAHALRPLLEANARVDTFELAVRYQFYHSFAILFAGILMYNFPSRHINRAVLFFLAGTIIFSGTLYAMSITGIRILGAITPVGGLCLIGGWLLLFVGINAKRFP